MSSPGSVVTLGETMALLGTPGSGRLFNGSSLPLGLGGAESNVAVNLARQGHTTAWGSALGNDPLGDVVRPTYVLSYALGSLVAMAVGYGLTLLTQRTAPPVRARLRAAYIGQGSAVSNTGYVGYPVVQAVVLLGAVFTIVSNLVVDLSYSIIDPRIRRAEDADRVVPPRAHDVVVAHEAAPAFE